MVLDEMLQVKKPIIELEGQLEQIQVQMQSAQEPELSRLLETYSELQEQMDALDGWNYLHHIETVLTKLGFHEDDFDKKIAQLSGGWKNRVAFAKVLLEEPEVMLLDEPTNHLDVKATEWLEGYLQQYRGSFILVSHDRYFLDNVVDRIVEIENYKLQDYRGGYSFYVRERKRRLKALMKEFQAQERELLENEEQFIHENWEQQRRMKRKLWEIKKRSQNIKSLHPIRTDFMFRKPSSKDVIEISGISKRFGDLLLFRDFSLIAQRGNKIGVIGPNGCGKTTLLKIIAEEIEPDSGTIKYAKNITIGFLQQFSTELDDEKTVFEVIKASAPRDVTRNKKRSFLSAFFFNELDLKRSVSELSGGERRRLMLAKFLSQGTDLLLLDEPTNHLDLYSTQILEQAIKDFSGAVFVVTHDRFFLDKVATSLLTATISRLGRESLTSPIFSLIWSSGI